MKKFILIVLILLLASPAMAFWGVNKGTRYVVFDNISIGKLGVLISAPVPMKDTIGKLSYFVLVKRAAKITMTYLVGPGINNTFITPADGGAIKAGCDNTSEVFDNITTAIFTDEMKIKITETHNATGAVTLHLIVQ